MRAAEQLLPLLCDELRRLAEVRLAGERPGQTQQATAVLGILPSTADRHWAYAWACLYSELSEPE
ncbi:MAG: ECF-type sigma factor [Phycisphaerales bacterium]